MSEQNNKNDLQEENILLPNATQSTKAIIPMTVIPKQDRRPNLMCLNKTEPETPAFRLIPVQNFCERKMINFSVWGPINIILDENNTCNSGCSVLDLIMPAPSQISEIVFQNFYTSSITVLAYFEKDIHIQLTNKCPSALDNKVIGPLPGGVKTLSLCSNGNQCIPSATVSNSYTNICEWIVAVPHKVLMPNPHYENGSQDYISITSSESFVALQDVRALRLILHQPSPIWHTFYVEELKIYSEMACNNSTPHISGIPTLVDQYPFLALLRCQTMGTIFKKSNMKANAPNNMEIPNYEFFNLPLEQ